MRNSIAVKAKQRSAVGVVILAALALTLVGLALTVSPIPQPLAYHNFAERRTLLGIPHIGDVVSNLAYLAAALMGLSFVFCRKGLATLATLEDRLPYIVFFVGVGAVGIGSTYYHLNPNNQTLFWDRLPMTVAFTSILAAFIGDRIHAKAGAFLVLPSVLILGAASLLFWHIGEANGQGDLRFYFLVQATTIISIPLICLLFPGRHTSGKYVVYMLVLYGLGIACEQLDVRIFEILDGAVSGHTIKHILTASAIYMVVPMLQNAPHRSTS